MSKVEYLTRALPGTVLACGCFLFYGSVSSVMADRDGKQASRLVDNYFRAVAKEDISEIEKIYFFTDSEQREEILAQFKFAFDMADTRLESVMIERTDVNREHGSGLVFVNVNAILTSADGTDTLKKEKKLVAILRLSDRKWKIRKVMPRGVYDSYVRLAVYNATPEFLEAQQNPPAVKGAASVDESNDIISDATSVTIQSIRQDESDIIVNLAATGLSSGVLLHGELANVKARNVVERGMGLVAAEGTATLRFHAPFPGWVKGKYKVKIRVDDALVASRAIDIND